MPLPLVVVRAPLADEPCDSIRAGLFRTLPRPRVVDLAGIADGAGFEDVTVVVVARVGALENAWTVVSV